VEYTGDQLEQRVIVIDYQNTHRALYWFGNPSSPTHDPTEYRLIARPVAGEDAKKGGERQLSPSFAPIREIA
jgi:hypothetical protein